MAKLAEGLREYTYVERQALLDAVDAERDRRTPAGSSMTTDQTMHDASASPCIVDGHCVQVEVGRAWPVARAAVADGRIGAAGRTIRPRASRPGDPRATPRPGLVRFLGFPMHLARAVLAVVVLAASLVTPVRAQNCAPFTDVLAADQFCSNIQWMFNRGVTLGCTANQYCPANFVRRDQMAAFMNRLADSLFPLTCSSGQVMKWNGTTWACSNDNAGSGGGTVTSISAGTGLQGSPNPITTTGALNLAPGYQLPQGCANGQVAKSNGSGGWTCQADANSGGSVTSVTAGTGLTGGVITGTGTIAADTAFLQRRVTATCAAGSSIRTINADGTVVCEPDDIGAANSFVQGGNAFASTAVLGTTDNQALDIRVNGVQVMRYQPNATSANIVGGHPNNYASPAHHGQTVSGGGSPGIDCYEPSQFSFTRACANWSLSDYGTVAGGQANVAVGSSSTVLGGSSNTAHGSASTVAGGSRNNAGLYSAVLGGYQNTASGLESAVLGGSNNTASGDVSTILGGSANIASGNESTVLGGTNNTASGFGSIAGGRSARALHPGCMVLGDRSTAFNNVSCAAPNQFIVRALGGTYLFTGGTTDLTYTGVYVGPGSGAWAVYSDRDGKEEINAVDPVDVVKRLAAIPMATWQWKAEPNRVRHIGPMAQDFHAAFGLGASDRHISTVDADGVALAAVQGVYQLVQQKDAEMAKLRSESAELKRELAELRTTQHREVAELRLAIEVLMARTSAEGRVAQTRSEPRSLLRYRPT